MCNKGMYTKPLIFTVDQKPWLIPSINPGTTLDQYWINTLSTPQLTLNRNSIQFDTLVDYFSIDAYESVHT